MEQPRTRLPLPRARSVSHLRSQSQAQAQASSIPITKPSLSRKPSVPLRSNARQAVGVHHGTAPVPVEVRAARVASGLVMRPHSVVETTQTRGRTFTSTATVTHGAGARAGAGNTTTTTAETGRGRGEDPFLVRQSSISNLTTISKTKSQTLPTRFCPTAKSSPAVTKTKALPIRPALPSHSNGATTTATSANTVAIATGRSKSTTGSSAGTTGVSKSRHGTPLALGAKRTIGPAGNIKTQPQISFTAKPSSYVPFKPTSTTKAISRKPSSRLRGSPAPAPAPARGSVAIPAHGSTGVSPEKHVGHLGDGPAISASDSEPSTASGPPPALAPVRVQKLHYGHPPVERQIRRVVSRGFAMTKFATSPDKTIHTPSPTKRSHQLAPTSISDPAALSETPLMPRLISRHMQIPTDIENMPMIADASFDFGDSTNSTTTMGNISTSNLDPYFNHPVVNVAKSDLDVVSRSEFVELEQENEVLKSALRALEVATSRITSERDLARQSEAKIQESVERKRWEAVREAIKDEIERTRQYKEDLAKWKIAINLGSGVTDT